MSQHYRALKDQTLELTDKYMTHREMDPLKVAGKEEIVTKSYACWAGDSYLLPSAQRQVVSGFHIVTMSRVCILERSL